MYKVVNKYKGKTINLNVKGYGMHIPLEENTPQHLLEIAYKAGVKGVVIDKKKKDDETK